MDFLCLCVRREVDVIGCVELGGKSFRSGETLVEDGFRVGGDGDRHGREG